VERARAASRADHAPSAPTALQAEHGRPLNLPPSRRGPAGPAVDGTARAEGWWAERGLERTGQSSS
jgi:hypothetical protein